MYSCLNSRALGLDLSPGQTIALAAAAGFGGVDLLVRDLVDSGADVREVRQRLDDAGLRGGAFPLPVQWRGSGEEFRRDLDRLERYAEAAAALGLLRTGTWVWPEIPAGAALTGDDSRAAAVSFHQDRLGAIAEVLSRQKIRLGLEAIGVASALTGTGEPFVARLGDVGPVLEAVEAVAPDVGILVDGFHLQAACEPSATALAWGVRKVAWVHVADLPAGVDSDRSLIRDADRALPGERGVGFTAELLRLLAEAGYEGPVTPEPMPGCRALVGLTPLKAVERTAEFLRSVWPSQATMGPGSSSALRSRFN